MMSDSSLLLGLRRRGTLMSKNLIFGLGTGRCGTTTLSHLLTEQESSSISHELGGALPFLSWEKDRPSLLRFLGIIHNRSEAYVGDISFYLLPYVSDICRTFPSAKFIVLKRDKQETISSYMRKTEGRNHWMNHDGTEWKRDIWDKCYPKYNTSSKIEALSSYYDEYYEACERIKNDNFFFLNTEDLNDELKCSEMFEFCGYSEYKFVKIRANKNKKN